MSIAPAPAAAAAAAAHRDGQAQGDVTLFHFPGILGAMGWGWLHPR